MSVYKKLSEVKVGTLIRHNGVNYEVTKNRLNALDLKRGGIKLHSETIGIPKGPSIQVEVVGEPKTATPSLTEELKKQVAQADLTKSLKAQVEGKPGVVVASGIAGKATQLVDGKARFQNEITRAGLKRVEERVEEVKGYANDVAAQFDEFADDTVQEIEDVKRDLADLENDVDRVHYNVQQIDSQLDNLVSQSNREFDHLSGRVQKLEEKGRKEEVQNQLQARLNAELASKKQNNKTTGGVNMKNVLGQFKGLFGKVEGQFGLAATGGIAMRKGISNEFVTYNKANGQITDVSSFVLDFKVPAFRLPVEAKDIKVGDIVLNNNDYGYVTQVVENGEYVKTVQPAKASQSTVIPVTNFLFGKPFYTVVTTIDAAGQGGFNPALLLAMGDGKKDDILPFLLMSGGLGGNGAGAAGGIDPTMLMLLGDNVDELLPFLLMQQGGVTQEGFNPLMLLALSGDKGGSKKDSLLPLLAMSGGLGNGAQAGGINPMMLMALGGDSDIDPLTLMALSGGFGGNQQGGIFGANPATSSVQAPATKKEDTK